MNNSDVLKVPLIVSVVGHKDITTPETVLEAYFDAFWQKLRAELGENTPFILLSSLAEGADHLAVKYRPEDVPYYAVLPFAIEEYEKDFSGTATALEEFRTDLKGACKCITCDATPGDYTKASDYVRKYADVIVMLWDGIETLDENGNAAEGGTYYVFRKVMQLDKLLIRQPEKHHLVVTFSVTRSKPHKENEKKFFESDNCWGTPIPDEGTYPFRIEPGTISFSVNPEILSNIEHIREHNNKCAVEQDPAEMSYLYIGCKNQFPDLFELVKNDFLRYEYFDRVALENQRSHKWEFLVIAILSFAAGFCGQLWGDVTFCNNTNMHEWVVHGVIFAYLSSCLWAFLYYRSVKKARHYEEYVEPRAIAELLRLNIFWKLSAIGEDFVENILSNSANYWCSLAICNWNIAAPPLTDAEKSLLEAEKLQSFPTVRDMWVNDQKMYYNGYILSDTKSAFRIHSNEKLPSWRTPVKRIKKYFRPYRRIDRCFGLLKGMFFWGGFLLAAMLLIVFALAKLECFSRLDDHTEIAGLKYYREFIVGLCPFLVATIGWLLEKNQWNAIGERYLKLYYAFEKTAAVLEKPDVKPEVKQKLIKELMILAHQENSEWESIKKGSTPEPML